MTDSDRLPASRIAEVYEKWLPDVRRFLWALTRQPELAEELVQATFSRFLESGAGVCEGAERAWLFRVAHNEVGKWRRRNGIHSRGLEKATRQVAMRSEPEPWHRVSSREDVERVRRALAELPSEQRQVVEQRIHGGYTFAKIAKEAGVPLGTVLTRMRLALVKLERRLREE